MNAFVSSVPFRLHRRRLDQYVWCASHASIYPLVVSARRLRPGALKRLHAHVLKSSGSAARGAILLNWLAGGPGPAFGAWGVIEGDGTPLKTP